MKTMRKRVRHQLAWAGLTAFCLAAAYAASEPGLTVEVSLGGKSPGEEISGGAAQQIMRRTELVLADALPTARTLEADGGQIAFESLAVDDVVIQTQAVIAVTLDLGTIVEFPMAVETTAEYRVQSLDGESAMLAGTVGEITFDPAIAPLVSAELEMAIRDLLGILASSGSLTAKAGEEAGFSYDEALGELPGGTVPELPATIEEIRVIVTDTFLPDLYVAPTTSGVLTLSSELSSDSGFQAGPFIAEFPVAGESPEEPIVRFLPQVGDGVAGDIRFQTTVVLANTGAATEATVDFFQSDGSELSLMLGEQGPAASFVFQMARGESLSLQTPGTDAIRVGYARIRSLGQVGATAVLTRSLPASGTVLYETGVAAVNPVSDFSVALDSLGNNDTGLAIVNPSEGPAPAQSARITLRLYDSDANLITTRPLDLPPGGHIPRFIWEFFADTNPQASAQAREMRGSLTVESDRPLAAVTLRQNDDTSLQFPDKVPTLTTFPVAPARFEQAAPAGPSEAVFYFPQIGDGLAGPIGFRSTLVFLNTGAATTATVEFFDSEGSPLELELAGLGVGSVFEIPLAAGQSFFAASSGEADLKVGYARVTAGSGVAGTAVFSRSDTASGILLYEAGVPATTTLQDMTVALDSLGVRDTGLALVRPPGSQDGSGTVIIRLYDTQFQLLGSQQIVLLPGAHLPRFIWEFFDAESPQVAEQARELLGVVTVESDTDIVAVTLRQNDDGALDFPDEVPALTSYPVIRGRADSGQPQN